MFSSSVAWGTPRVSRRTKATLFLLCLLTILGVAPPVRAQDGATLVAVVTAEPNAPLTRRVRAELQALGVDVIVLNGVLPKY